MRRFAWLAVHTVRRIVYLAVSGLMGGFAVGVGVYIYHLETRPDLQLWHMVELESEYDVGRDGNTMSFDSYRQLEERLYEELEVKVRDRLERRDRTVFNRFNSGSLVDPRAHPINWNRSFELPAENPRAGALMLHGLSDSPYSMRPLAEWLNSQGVWVVGLRLPGHGTAPSGLVEVSWEDFKAATRIAAVHLREVIGPDTPLHMFGYSNGAALAVEYALSRLGGENLPRVDRLVMLSPAISVTSLAQFAVWQGKLGYWLGLEKLAWNSIQPEFDPYKYNSFAVNAGDQIYRLTRSIGEQIDRLDGGGGVSGMPPMLALQSVADATTSVTGLVVQLYDRMAPGSHELVFFDINRLAETKVFVSSGHDPLIQRLLGSGGLPYDFTLVTNVSDDSAALVELRKAPVTERVARRNLTLSWPRNLYSLSHVALPFPMDDPVYGISGGREDIVQFGDLELRGERGLLLVPESQLTRLRYNPFFEYLKDRIAVFLDLDLTSSSQAGQ